MLEIKYKIWPFVKPSGQVALRVSWNNSKSKVEFSTDVYAEKSKWDCDMHKAKKKTTHSVNNRNICAEFTAEQINEQIALYREEIDDAFYQYAMKNSVPDNDELKLMVNSALGKGNSIEESTTADRRTLKELFDEFIKKGVREKNWDSKCIEKYDQAYHHFIYANPGIEPKNITEDSMYNLREWYIKNRYRNRTTNKQFIMLKAFLKFLDDTGECRLSDKVLKYKTNLKVIKKTVTFLHYKELLEFSRFKFKKSDSRLEQARDFWCFMAFTSLRYSDLSLLRPGHIIENKGIEKVAQKTDERLYIPLTEGALRIIAKYKNHPGPDGLLFDVTTNQKLNDAIKDAAKVAGLDREIVDTYYIGTERKEESFKFYEIISCHDARRTFVSCSLAMGIPAQVVMKCTGHSDYATMKPYIETATETQSLEMERWNSNQYKSQIMSLLDKSSEDDLKDILELIKRKVVLKQDISAEMEDKETEYEDDEETAPILDYDDDSPINIMEEIANGNIIHVEYNPYDNAYAM